MRTPFRHIQFFSLLVTGILAGFTQVSLAKDLPAKQLEDIQLQIYLDQQHFGPGVLDGKPGKYTRMAIEAYNLKFGFKGSDETAVRNAAKEKNILVNVADTPELCDFYLGGIVTKGNVKIAISTNGKSPTTAKRLRQFFEAVIPDDINQLVQNLNTYRKTIKGNFEDKVSALNKITENLIQK